MPLACVRGRQLSRAKYACYTLRPHPQVLQRLHVIQALQHSDAIARHVQRGQLALRKTQNSWRECRPFKGSPAPPRTCEPRFSRRSMPLWLRYSSSSSVRSSRPSIRVRRLLCTSRRTRRRSVLRPCVTKAGRGVACVGSGQCSVGQYVPTAVPQCVRSCSCPATAPPAAPAAPGPRSPAVER